MFRARISACLAALLPLSKPDLIDRFTTYKVKCESAGTGIMTLNKLFIKQRPQSGMSFIHSCLISKMNCAIAKTIFAAKLCIVIVMIRRSAISSAISVYLAAKAKDQAD